MDLVATQVVRYLWPHIHIYVVDIVVVFFSLAEKSTPGFINKIVWNVRNVFPWATVSNWSGIEFDKSVGNQYIFDSTRLFGLGAGKNNYFHY